MSNGSFSSVFSGKLVANEKGICTTSSSLSALFSEKSKEKFERVFKPEEFIAPKKEPAEDGTKKVKKRKHKAIAAEQALLEQTSAEQTVNEIRGTQSDATDSSESARTVFVGNIPTSESVKSLKKLFIDVGEVESIRLRSVPIGKHYFHRLVDNAW